MTFVNFLPSVICSLKQVETNEESDRVPILNNQNVTILINLKEVLLVLIRIKLHSKYFWIYIFIDIINIIHKKESHT